MPLPLLESCCWPPSPPFLLATFLCSRCGHASLVPIRASDDARRRELPLSAEGPSHSATLPFSLSALPLADSTPPHHLPSRGAFFCSSVGLPISPGSSLALGPLRGALLAPPIPVLPTKGNAPVPPVDRVAAVVVLAIGRPDLLTTEVVMGPLSLAPLPVLPAPA